jgi:hypothetical protein
MLASIKQAAVKPKLKGSEEHLKPVADFQRNRLSKLDGIMVTHLRVRRNMSIPELQLVTGFSERKVQYILRRWAPRFGEVGKAMCNFHVTVDFALMHAPQEWTDSPFGDCMLIGVGKDITCGEVRGNPHVRDLLFSSRLSRPRTPGNELDVIYGIISIAR